MSIAGNLKTMELAELLQWLAQGRKSGTLVFESGQVEKRIIFRDGRIASSSSTDPNEFLGHFLVSQGLISEQELAEAVGRQEEDQALIGSILVKMGAVAEDDLLRLLTLKAEETIYDVFTWEEGDFHFLDSELPEHSMVPISLDVTAVVLEGSRRVDEWRRIREAIPSLQAVPVAVGDLLADPELSDGERQVLGRVNDDRTVEELCLETHSSEFFVCHVLLRQLQAGNLKVVRPRAVDGPPALEAENLDAEALLRRSQWLLEQGSFEPSWRHLKAARSLEPDNHEIQAAIGQTEEVLRRALERDGVRPGAVPRLERTFDQLTTVASFTPQEAFVLSRADGRYDVASIIKISPMPPLDVLFVFWKLKKAGHLRLETPPAPRSARR